MVYNVLWNNPYHIQFTFFHLKHLWGFTWWTCTKKCVIVEWERLCGCRFVEQLKARKRVARFAFSPPDSKFLWNHIYLQVFWGYVSNKPICVSRFVSLETQILAHSCLWNRLCTLRQGSPLVLGQGEFCNTWREHFSHIFKACTEEKLF